jgi:signal transduction histidine kinase
MLSQVNVVHVLQLLLQSYQDRAAAKSLRLHLQHIGNNRTPFYPLIETDTQLFHEILDNLLSNAVKYSPHGKNIWLGVLEGAASIRTDPPTEPHVVIAVRDEGPGLSEQDKKQLFGKFARLSAKPTGGEHSTGLGLSIVKKLAHILGGDVWCESERDAGVAGATFFVRIPLHAPSKREIEEQNRATK